MRIVMILLLTARMLFAAIGDFAPRSGVVEYRPNLTRTTRIPLDDSGPSVRMNQDPIGNVQNEIAIASWIINPRIVLSGSNDYRNGDASGGFYVSLDGGYSYSDVLITRGPTDEFEAAGDPVAAIDRTGKMYVNYIAFDRSTNDGGLYTQTSTDSGATWSAPVALAQHLGGASNEFEDKPFAVCDLSPTSPYVNAHYVTWTHYTEFGLSPIYFTRSLDGGSTYSTPIQISSSQVNQFSCPTTGPNGEIYVVWTDYWSEMIAFNASFDGGVTWNNETVVVPMADLNDQPNPCGVFRTPSYAMVSCDISNGPRRGWVYVCWVAYNGDNPDVLLSSSSDSGATWTAPVRVDDGPMGSWQWWQWMSVHPETGDLGIAWLDRRDDEEGCFYRPYATVSTDGGESFMPSFPLTDVMSDPSAAGFLGDYNGVTFRQDGGFYFGWVDLRNDDGDAYSAWFSGQIPAPQGLVISIAGSDAWLAWQPVEGATYRVMTADTHDGPYLTLVGTTPDTSIVDPNAFALDNKRFYVVYAVAE